MTFKILGLHAPAGRPPAAAASGWPPPRCTGCSARWACAAPPAPPRPPAAAMPRDPRPPHLWRAGAGRGGAGRLRVGRTVGCGGRCCWWSDVCLPQPARLTQPASPCPSHCLIYVFGAINARPLARPPARPPARLCCSASAFQLAASEAPLPELGKKATPKHPPPHPTLLTAPQPARPPPLPPRACPAHPCSASASSPGAAPLPASQPR